MNTATIYKGDFMNMAMWAEFVKDLGLPVDTDEICVKKITYITESQRQEKDRIEYNGQ